MECAGPAQSLVLDDLHHRNASTTAIRSNVAHGQTWRILHGRRQLGHPGSIFFNIFHNIEIKLSQTENILFKVWNITFLRHSEWFRHRLTKGLEAERYEDDSYPLVLEGIKSSDFERLLWILYPQ